MEVDVAPLRPFTVNSVEYLAIPQDQSINLPFHKPHSLVTVFSIGTTTTITLAWVKTILQHFEEIDDVWQVGFLQGVIFAHSSSSKAELESDAQDFLELLGTEWLEFVDISGLDAQTVQGPYILLEHGLIEVRRLYDDDHQAFVTSVTPDTKNLPAYKELFYGKDALKPVRVAVPSRLRYDNSKKFPLAGLRIAVKDNHLVQGITTSVCNKAFDELYPPADQTAECLHNIEKCGGLILGKTKLASFAATEEPIECIDFAAPWNPRGDGYQSPAGSSSGSGAACAAYEWLDVTIGSDTSGSGRRPAHWNGCFGMRPTYGAVHSHGLVPSFPRFDTSTFFARDINLCYRFAKEWYGRSLDPKKGQTFEAVPFGRIIFPTDYMSLIENKAQQDVIAEFVGDLEKFLGSKRETMSFEDLWAEKPPSEAGGQSLNDYMAEACRNSFFYDDYHNFDSFRQEYLTSYGRQPYISPPVRWQWNLSSHITLEQRNIAMERLEVYRKWFQLEVLKDHETTPALVVIPIEEISPRYRDEPSTRHFNPIGVPMLFLSPILGGPEVTIPAGQIPYDSKVSGNEELLPVGISMLTSPGEDLALLDMTRHFLKESCRHLQVATGRMMFP